MHALNALTFFINPFVVNNYSAQKAFERRWRVSFRKTRKTLFPELYRGVSEAKTFTLEELAFIEDFSRTLLACNITTASKIMDSWDKLCDSRNLKFGTSRGKIIKLYWGLIEDLKHNLKVTNYQPLLASEIIDAFAWLFEIEAEAYIYQDG